MLLLRRGTESEITKDNEFNLSEKGQINDLFNKKIFKHRRCRHHHHHNHHPVPLPPEICLK